MTSNPTAVDDALNALRTPVTQILDEGNDPAEVLALGMLVSSYAPDGTDLLHLGAVLQHSTLGDTVSTVAESIAEPEQPPAGKSSTELDEDTPTGGDTDEEDLIGEN